MEETTVIKTTVVYSRDSSVLELSDQWYIVETTVLEPSVVYSRDNSGGDNSAWMNTSIHPAKVINCI